MDNLNVVWNFDDETDRWAAQREYELRRERYQRWLDGGVIGAAKRLSERFDELTRVLAGDQSR